MDIYYPPRDTDNSSVTPQSFTIQPGATLVLADAILGTFGQSSSAGAFRVTSAGQVLTTCRIYNKENHATFGQGLEGVQAGSAVTPNSPTDIVGMASNGTAGTQGTFRSNIFAVNTSSSSTSLTFDIMDTAGTSLGSKSYTLQPFAAFFKSIGDIGAGNFDNATLHVTATSGSAVVVASKNDHVSSDGTTLEAGWTGGGASSADGTYALAGYERDAAAHPFDGVGWTRHLPPLGAVARSHHPFVLHHVEQPCRPRIAQVEPPLDEAGGRLAGRNDESGGGLEHGIGELLPIAGGSALAAALRAPERRMGQHVPLVIRLAEPLGVPHHGGDLLFGDQRTV